MLGVRDLLGVLGAQRGDGMIPLAKALLEQGRGASDGILRTFGSGRIARVAFLRSRRMLARFVRAALDLRLELDDSLARSLARGGKLVIVLLDHFGEPCLEAALRSRNRIRVVGGRRALIRLRLLAYSVFEGRDVGACSFRIRLRPFQLVLERRYVAVAVGACTCELFDAGRIPRLHRCRMKILQLAQTPSGFAELGLVGTRERSELGLKLLELFGARRSFGVERSFESFARSSGFRILELSPLLQPSDRLFELPHANLVRRLRFAREHAGLVFGRAGDVVGLALREREILLSRALELGESAGVRGFELLLLGAKLEIFVGVPPRLGEREVAFGGRPNLVGFALQRLELRLES
jgi:hypothetical protein